MRIKKNYIDNIASILLGGVMDQNKNRASNEVIQRIDDIEDINLAGDQGRTFLIHCCAYDYYDLAQIAVERGANVNAQDHDGFTPLHAAVLCKDSALVGFLLKNGAIPNLKNKYGNTPAFYAAANYEILKLLLDFGCDIYLKNKSNVSAYDIALLHPDIMENLKEYSKLT